MAIRAGVAAAAVALAVLGVCWWQASGRVLEVGFWYVVDSTELPPETAAVLGAPITRPELRRIEALSRDELARALTGLRVAFTTNRSAFWRVEVRRDLEVDEHSPYHGPPSASAESFPMGPLGGRATISFYSLAQYAVAFAPPGATRDQMLGGIARGIARAAAHEIAHLAAGGLAHDPDVNTYEYPQPDRPAQYYGDLHWGRAWPQLVAKIGR